MAKRFEQPFKKNKKSDNRAIAIIGLVLNLLVLPGLGSLIGGKTKEGVWQLVLSVLSGVLIFTGILLTVSLVLMWVGIPMIILGSFCSIAAWIWGLITGIQMIKESN